MSEPRPVFMGQGMSDGNRVVKSSRFAEGPTCIRRPPAV